MTFDEKMREMLVERGMTDNHALEIIGVAKAAEELASMKDRWDDDTGDYPEFLLNVLWMNVKILVLKWIDTNHPEYWYRPMFT